MGEPAKPVEDKRPGSKIKWGIWIALFAIFGVVAVIAAVAVDVNEDYVSRANNNEAISLMKSARTGLSLHFQDERKWPVKLEEVASNVSGTYTESVRITKGAGGAGEIELTATMRTQVAHERVAGKTIQMVSSDGGKTWICKRGTMPVEFLPIECKN